MGRARRDGEREADHCPTVLGVCLCRTSGQRDCLPGAETRTRTSEAPDLLALNARTWLGSERFGVGATDRCDGEFARLDQSQPWSNAAGKNPPPVRAHGQPIDCAQNSPEQCRLACRWALAMDRVRSLGLCLLLGAPGPHPSFFRVRPIGDSTGTCAYPNHRPRETSARSYRSTPIDGNAAFTVYCQSAP